MDACDYSTYSLSHLSTDDPPMTVKEPCPIWGGSIVEVYTDIGRRTKFVRDCARAGGGYTITKEAERIVATFDDYQKAKISTWIIDHQPRTVKDFPLSSLEYPEVTTRVVGGAVKQPLMPVQDRAERLLRLIALRSVTIGGQVSIQDDLQSALAWSESTTDVEVYFCLDYLQQSGWLKLIKFTDIDYMATVTVAGYMKMSEHKVNVDSSQAFVAMWFSECMESLFDKGIRIAVEEAGYRPLRIDQKPDINKIDDEIISEIRRSKFVVADFTHGADGARGGVYYEAGFASGIGIPVIYSCRKDMVENIHFDTRQYAHILWETPEQLRSSLRHRILARLGEGPNRHEIGE